jgi:hypothetical protein
MGRFCAIDINAPRSRSTHSKCRGRRRLSSFVIWKTRETVRLPPVSLFAGFSHGSTDGNFYGTNNLGGANNLGTFFKISTGLGPFVKALRPYGHIGQTAYILGTGLTGSTSVTFNGTAATTFSVVSDSEITAVIPAGATNGSLQVVTPGGTVSSVVKFQVFQ